MSIFCLVAASSRTISTSSSKTRNRCLPGIAETTSSVKIFGTVERLFDFDLNRAYLSIFSEENLACREGGKG